MAVQLKAEDDGPYLGAFVTKSAARQKGARNGEIRYRGPKHLITIGPTGACKTAGIIIPNVSHLRRSMVITDPKGQIAAITARKRASLGRVVVLNPFGLFVDELPHLKSNGFNPLSQLDPASISFPDDAAAIAQAIIPMAHDQNPFFPVSARNIVTAFVMWERMTKGTKASLLDVRRAILASSTYGADKLPASGFMKSLFDMACSSYYPVADLGDRLVGRLTDKNAHGTSVQDVIETINADTFFLSSPAIAEDLKGEGFDFAEMRRSIITFYIILPTAELYSHGSWLRVVVTSALRALYKPVPPSEPQSLPPILFLLDEFARFGRLESIEAAFGIARDSGLQVWPFLQDLAQLKGLYPEWETFFANAGAVSIFSTKDELTSKYLSARCGDKSAMGFSQTTRDAEGGYLGHRVETSFNFSEVGTPLIRQSEVAEIPPQQMLSIVDPESRPIFTHAPPYPWTPYGLGLDDNPYFRPRSG